MVAQVVDQSEVDRRVVQQVVAEESRAAGERHRRDVERIRRQRGEPARARAEAAERGIAVETHATHLLVHGVLHLLGYDHMTEEEANAMEAIERDALGRLGLPDPYLVRED